MEMHKKPRESNIELMRIVAMLMIITFHILRHCIREQLVDTSLIKLFGTQDYFCHPKFYSKLMWLYLIMPFGKIGNGMFIMISGYFMANRKINLVRTGKKLVEQMAYITMVLMFLSYAFFYFFYDGDDGIRINLTSLERFNNNSWFIGYYILIIIIAGLILNKYLQKWDKRNYLVFLAVVFCIVSFGWSGDFLEGISDDLRILGIGIFYYALGGYLRRFDPFKDVKTGVFVVLIILSNLFLMFSYRNQVLDAIVDYQFGSKDKYFIQPFEVIDEYSWVAVILSICVFCIFTRIHIKPDRFINFLGSSTFMIYLFHDNNFMYSLWKSINWIRPLKKNLGIFALRYLFWVALIFVGGTLLYLLYLQIVKLCRALWNRCKKQTAAETKS